MRYYLGTNTVSVVVPDPLPPPGPNPDWPLTLVSADPHGNVVVKVPYLDASAYVKPEVMIVAYVPGGATPSTPDAILSAPGVKTGEAPFPPSFGIGFDQNVPVVVPGPFASGPYTVAVIGRVP